MSGMKNLTVINHASLYSYGDSLGKYYVGSTNDLERRLNEHNYGHSKLKFKIFDDTDAPNEFDELMLISGSTDRVASYYGGLTNTETHDPLARALQKTMLYAPDATLVGSPLCTVGQCGLQS